MSSWEEKIAMKKKFKEKQVPFIKSFYEAYQPFGASDLAIAIKNAAKVIRNGVYKNLMVERIRENKGKNGKPPLLQVTSDLLQNEKVVVKPSHMTSGSYVFIVSGDHVTIPRPAGPGSHVMRDREEKWRQRRRRIMLHDVVRGIGNAMEQNAGE